MPQLKKTIYINIFFILYHDYKSLEYIVLNDLVFVHKMNSKWQTSLEFAHQLELKIIML